MAYTEFCCRAGGSNLNAGTLLGDSVVPPVTPFAEYGSGSWVQSTGVFTLASGNPIDDGVIVGHWASVYPDADIQTGFVGQITAVSSTTITVSLASKGGTAPVDGSVNTSLRVGGAWQGPHGSVAFPFGFLVDAMRVSNVYARCNMSGTYNVTSQLATGSLNIFQGFDSAYDDGGKATINGGSIGASYVVLRINSPSACIDLICDGNGDTGTSDLILLSNSSTVAIGIAAVNSRGTGINVGTGIAVGCEAYGCNTSDVSGGAGIRLAGGVVQNCVSHHNGVGVNGNGFIGTDGTHINCIAWGNTGNGFLCNTLAADYIACCAYKNDRSGFNNSNSGNRHSLTLDCNSFSNGMAIQQSAALQLCFNLAIGSGAAADGGGYPGYRPNQIGTIVYPAGETPWADPDNGDFRLTHALAKGTGTGKFSMTQGGYSGGTVGYPDRGAAQSQATAGGSIIIIED